MIRLKIDVTKIDKSKLFVGAKGTYLDLTLMENRNGPDQYGNDFMVVQDLGREARERGEKGSILGNGKTIGGGNARPSSPAPNRNSPPPRQESAGAASDPDVPFKNREIEHG